MKIKLAFLLEYGILRCSQLRATTKLRELMKDLSSKIKYFKEGIAQPFNASIVDYGDKNTVDICIEGAGVDSGQGAGNPLWITVSRKKAIELQNRG